MPPTLSIVVPAFNESARIGPSLQKVVKYLAEQHGPSELIVVDDGSSDDTAAVAESAVRDSGSIETRVIRYEENRGKGYAVRLGLLEAKANIALFSDADLSTPIAEAAKLIDPIVSLGLAALELFGRYGRQRAPIQPLRQIGPLRHRLCR